MYNKLRYLKKKGSAVIKYFTACFVVICVLALFAPISRANTDICDPLISEHSEVVREYCINSAAAQKLIAETEEDIEKILELLEQQLVFRSHIRKLSAQIKAIIAAQEKDSEKSLRTLIQISGPLARLNKFFSQLEAVEKKKIAVTVQKDARTRELAKLKKRRGELYKILMTTDFLSPGQKI